MTQPRRKLVCLSDTPYYHVISRCVRRTYLCGIDQSSGKSYEHRRQWIVDRIRILSSLFAIDICSYTVMSNHFHIVLKISPEQSKEWTEDNTLERWTSLFKGPLLIQKYKAGKELSPAEMSTVKDSIKVYRQRLSSLSWFMKCLNEPVAREANKEDGCTGHFWEARFKSQALRSEEALLSCMAYVDLNPIRAAMANTPENSDYTSIQERITPRLNLKKAIKQQMAFHTLQKFDLPLKPLLHFQERINSHQQTGIIFTLNHYLELVDSTGRAIRDDKRGFIGSDLPPILKRLKVSNKDWMKNVTKFEQGIYHKFTQRNSKFPSG